MQKTADVVNTACVYKKVNESVFTYVYCCTMNSFLHALFSDMLVADAIAQQLPALICLLCDSALQIDPADSNRLGLYRSAA